ncbi:MAG: ribosome silencing factor [Polyangiales bacterium]
MATKKNTKPKISSSHSKRPATKRPVKKTAAAPGKPVGTRVGKPTRPKRPAEKPSRTAMRSERISSGAPSKRPRPQPESVRNESQLASQALALLVAKAALDKKAVNVQIVDVVGRVDYADYLVVMSGRSDRHVLAVADGIEDELVKLTPKRKPIAVEGRPQGTWVVLDFGEVVAHVFQEDARSFYDLDNLWQDARKVPIAREAEGAPRSVVS